MIKIILVIYDLESLGAGALLLDYAKGENNEMHSVQTR